MSKWIKWVILFLVILIPVLLYVGIEFGTKVILMSERQDTQTILERLYYDFDTDFRPYSELNYEDVKIKSFDGLNLSGFYYDLNPDSNKVVIINHGYTANHFITYQFTDVFFEEGYNVLLIDMRSHGESEGEYTTYGYMESKDIGSWVEWVKSRKGENASIGLHGQSMGGSTVMLYGGTHPDKIKFVIEDCGFTTAKEAIRYQFEEANIPFKPLYELIRFNVNRKYDFDLSYISPEDAIINSEIPTLFIHGAVDNVVPAWMTEKLYNEKQGPKDMLYIVKGAKHMESYSKDKKEYKRVVREFLKQLE